MKRSCFTIVGLLIASAAATASADIETTLTQLHDAGANLQSLSADVTLRDSDLGGLGDDDKIFAATLLVRRVDGDTEAFAHFDGKTVGNKAIAYRRDVLLKGGEVIDRDYSQDPKKGTVRKLTGAGQKLDPFKLGEGPFPLPIGQLPEDVKKQFDVSQDKGALVLVPKPRTALADKYAQIAVKVDSVTHFPTEVQTLDANKTTKTTITLTNIKFNPQLAAKAFELPPREGTWNVVPAS